MMRFDKSSSTVVVTCDECGSLWATIALSLNEAARKSIEHERQVHKVPAGNTQGYNIIYSATRRGR